MRLSENTISVWEEALCAAWQEEADVLPSIQSGGQWNPSEAALLFLTSPRWSRTLLRWCHFLCCILRAAQRSSSSSSSFTVIKGKCHLLFRTWLRPAQHHCWFLWWRQWRGWCRRRGRGLPPVAPLPTGQHSPEGRDFLQTSKRMLNIGSEFIDWV